MQSPRLFKHTPLFLPLPICTCDCCYGILLLLPFARQLKPVLFSVLPACLPCCHHYCYILDYSCLFIQMHISLSPYFLLPSVIYARMYGKKVVLDWGSFQCMDIHSEYLITIIWLRVGRDALYFFFILGMLSLTKIRVLETEKKMFRKWY